jgi:hypothetical protein
MYVKHFGGANFLDAPIMAAFAGGRSVVCLCGCVCCAGGARQLGTVHRTAHAPRVSDVLPVLSCLFRCLFFPCSPGTAPYRTVPQRNQTIVKVGASCSFVLCFC